MKNSKILDQNHRIFNKSGFTPMRHSEQWGFTTIKKKLLENVGQNIQQIKTIDAKRLFSRSCRCSTSSNDFMWRKFWKTPEFLNLVCKFCIPGTDEKLITFHCFCVPSGEQAWRGFDPPPSSTNPPFATHLHKKTQLFTKKRIFFKRKFRNQSLT